MNNAGNSSPSFTQNEKTKTAGLKAGAAQVNTKATQLRTLTYRRLNLTRADQIDNKFFKVAFQKQPAFNSIAFFEIEPNATNKVTTSTVTRHAFIAANEGMAFIDGNQPVTPSNKESLTTLLDIVVESGCERFIVCVEKKTIQEMQPIVQSYMMVGFQLDSSMVVPGYVLLSMEL